MGNPLTILLDSPQKRLYQDGLSTLVSGHDWDPTTWGSAFGTWVDPVARRAMLEPAPINAGWTQSSGGLFTKWGRSDFTLTGAGTWSDNNTDAGGPFMLYSNQDGNEANVGGYTNANLSANQAVCFEMFVPEGVPSNYPMVNLGWSNTHDGSVGVSLQVFGGGDCDVYKQGGLVGHYSIAGDLFGYYDANQNTFGAAPKGWLRLIMIPCSDRELLVVCPTFGGGFSHVFLDLPEATPDLTILDAAPFWFSVISPVYQPTVRVAPVQFASSGTIAGYPSGWREAPSAGGADGLYVYQDLSSGAVNVMGSNAALKAPISGFPTFFSVTNPVQLQFTLTHYVPSGGSPLYPSTPFVYGGIAYYDPVLASTATAGTSGGLDVTDYAMEGRIEIEDAIGGHHATIVLRSPGAIGELGSTNLTSMCDRAFELYDGSGVIGSYIAESPSVEDDFGYSDDDHDDAQEVTLTGVDGWKMAEDYEFGDPFPCDTLTLTEAITYVAKLIGYLVNISGDADAVLINASGVPAGGDWNYQIDVGERGSEALLKLVQTYVPNWWYDLTFDDTSKQWTFNLLSPGDMPSASAVTLYRSVEDAMTLGGYDAIHAPYFVYRKFKYHWLEPEATQAWTVGEDFRTGRPIAVYQTDLAASNPATPVASRPPNWCGYLKKCSFGTDALTTIGDATEANNLYFQRVTTVRMIAEWECEYLDGVSRGLLITLSKAMNYLPEANTGTDLVVRYKTLSGEFIMVDPDAGVQWRPVRMVGENSSLACPLGVGGTSIHQIKHNWRLRNRSKSRMSKSTSEVSRRPILNIQGS